MFFLFLSLLISFSWTIYDLIPALAWNPPIVILLVEHYTRSDKTYLHGLLWKYWSHSNILIRHRITFLTEALPRLHIKSQREWLIHCKTEAQNLHLNHYGCLHLPLISRGFLYIIVESVLKLYYVDYFSGSWDEAYCEKLISISNTWTHLVILVGHSIRENRLNILYEL